MDVPASSWRARLGKTVAMNCLRIVFELYKEYGTHLGSGTVNDTPDLSSGLPAISTVSSGGFELDLFLQSGSEYDFLTSRGMRDCTTGSGMTTQVSSNCTAGVLASSSVVIAALIAVDTMGTSTDENTIAVLVALLVVRDSEQGRGTGEGEKLGSMRLSETI